MWLFQKRKYLDIYPDRRCCWSWYSAMRRLSSWRWCRSCCCWCWCGRRWNWGRSGGGRSGWSGLQDAAHPLISIHILCTVVKLNQKNKLWTHNQRKVNFNRTKQKMLKYTFLYLSSKVTGIHYTTSIIVKKSSSKSCISRNCGNKN